MTIDGIEYWLKRVSVRYQEALNVERIRDPIGWALYTAWRDREELRKAIDKEVQDEIH